MKPSTADNFVWSVVRDIGPAPYSQIAAAVEQRAVERDMRPFWVHRAFSRLAGRGEIVLTERGYTTRSRKEVAGDQVRAATGGRG